MISIKRNARKYVHSFVTIITKMWVFLWLIFLLLLILHIKCSENQKLSESTSDYLNNLNRHSLNLKSNSEEPFLQPLTKLNFLWRFRLFSLKDILSAIKEIPLDLLKTAHVAVLFSDWHFLLFYYPCCQQIPHLQFLGKL